MRILRRLGFWSLPVLALAMVGLALVPANVWSRPEQGPAYEGLDANLVYTRDRSPGAPNEGSAEVSDGVLTLDAVPASEPVAHLLTTPLSFDTSVDVSVSESSVGSRPLRIAVWSVREDAAYYVDLGPSPMNEVTARVVEEGEVLSETVLGTYDLAQTYRIDLSVNREREELQTHVQSTDAIEAGRALRLDGGPADAEYGDTVSDPAPVLSGIDYDFGGRVRVISGADAYKIAVKWVDADGESLGFDGTWHGVKGLEGWTDVEFDATAPDGAAYARLFLGSGNGTSLLFSEVFLRRDGIDHENLLANGDFEDGRGWRIVEDRGVPQVVELQPLDVTHTVSAEDAPLLFDARRITLSASAYAAGEPAAAELTGFRLELPAELWQVVKTDDVEARILVGVLLAAGFVAVGVRLAVWTWRSVLPRARERLARPLAVSPGSSLTVVLLFLVYLGANVLLMSVASHPFDMTSARVWAYLGMEYGLLDIYPRASTVSLAEVWNGAPYHDAVFPYLPVLAYHYTGLGWLTELTLTGPDSLRQDSFALELMIKTANVAFGLGCAVLIYLIVRGSRLGRGAAYVAGALFMFNPALWLDMSLWGATETVSLFFILLSVWLAEKDSPVAAWLALGVAALTRPQMAILVVLLSIVYLRKFAWPRNVEAVSWTVVGSFIVMAPFLFYFAPSFPVDYVKRISDVQLAGGAEMALVSKGAYNIWPLVTGLFDGQSGLGRLQFPEDSALIGGMGYGQVSNLLLIALVAAIGSVLLLRPRESCTARYYLPFLALAMLGWGMLLTDMGARYLIYALGLVIASRPGLRTGPYLAVVAVLTVTISVTTYGVLGLAIENVPHLAPDLHSSNNLLTRLVMDLYSADWFITIGVVANVVALALLALEAVRPLLPAGEPAERAPEPALVRERPFA